ncbi:penicillin-binding transpeptidase domain-containing protein [Myxococcota bacterium]
MRRPPAQRWSRWLGIGAASGILLALVPVVQGSITLEDPLGRFQRQGSRAAEPPSLEGLDLTRLNLRPRRVTTRLAEGNTAELTLDPQIQRAATNQLERYRVPEGAVVVMQVQTGDLLAYASFQANGEREDLNVRAEAPSASVFKVVTGAALVEHGGLKATTKQCYHGGRSRITANELQDDPARDRWCATLASAMGRSLNVVFGRLARKHITPEELNATAGAFGYGAPIPFEVANQAPLIEMPEDPLEFARTSAGFWHTSLSPLAAVLIAQTVANAGVTFRPRIVRSIHRGRKQIWKAPGEPHVIRRAIQRSTASELTRMMVETVDNGSAHKSFHDRRGTPYLPNISVAGKTGTLTREKRNRYYTWFVGFAPADKPEIALAALVVNTPVWRIKAPLVAANVLRAYFAKQGRPGVSAP